MNFSKYSSFFHFVKADSRYARVKYNRFAKQLRGRKQVCGTLARVSLERNRVPGEVVQEVPVTFLLRSYSESVQGTIWSCAKTSRLQLDTWHSKLYVDWNYVISRIFFVSLLSRDFLDGDINGCSRTSITRRRDCI